jgi:hypothetical protein
MKELALKNRIVILKARPKDNNNVIKKLERKLRKLQETDNTK